MSIGGPSPLGTLLVQRVEAALGTTLSQQANVVSGARPDAVTQPPNPERPDATRNETQRHPREVVDRATAQAEQQGRHAVDKAKLDARTAALLLTRGTPNTSATPSAPTTLGHAARTILALLANFPEQAPAVAGRRPLLSPDGQGSGTGDARAPRGAAMGESLSAAGAMAGRAAAAGSTSASGASAGGAAAGAQGAATGASGAGASGASGTGASRSGAATGATAGPMAAAGPNAAMAGQLANALAQALKSSGMFYESHLNGLAFGKQSPAQLMQEPQALLGRSSLQASQGSGVASSGAGSAGNSAASTGTPAHAANAASTGGEVAASASSAAAMASAGAAARGDASLLGATAGGPTLAATAAAGTNPVPGLDPHTQLLVRQQLDVLANQTFTWRGEAWPDAPMDWEISRRQASSQDADAPSQTEHWATRISIQLPQLGTVQARLTLAGQQLVMHLVAPESASLLAEHTESLRTRYSSQGLQLSQISVAAHDVDSATGIGVDQDTGS